MDLKEKRTKRKKSRRRKTCRRKIKLMLCLWGFTNILLQENKWSINFIASATWRVLYKDCFTYPLFEEITYFLGRTQYWKLTYNKKLCAFTTWVSVECPLSVNIWNYVFNITTSDGLRFLVHSVKDCMCNSSTPSAQEDATYRDKHLV
jgi:hypothetical protein